VTIVDAVLGIDQSLTSTGLAGVDWAYSLKTPASLISGHERLAKIEREIFNLVDTGPVRVAVIERPAYGAVGNAKTQLAGLFTLITHLLWELGIPYAVVTSTNLKKFVTGNGKATKQDMIKTVSSYFPELGKLDSDQADAHGLVQMGHAYYYTPLLPLRKEQIEALAVPDWPTRLGD